MIEILERIELSSFLFVTIIILLVMVFAFIIIFFITYNRNLSIQRAMKNMERKHQEHNLATLETERQRFAQDLHDEIGASLSAIRLYVGDIYNQQTEEGEMKSKLRQVKNTIDQSMASTRRISHNILPPGLEHMGLSHVIKDLIQTFALTGQIEVKLKIADNIPKLNYNRELILYRVLQELLNNTIKHARATEITINFQIVDGIYRIEYRDNGIGFNVYELKEKGIGLKNVASRIMMAGGAFNYETGLGKGFFIQMNMPVIIP